MKINLILPGARSSGGVRVAFEYMNALVEKGHDVVCYVPASGAYIGWKKILFPRAMIRLVYSSDWKGKWFDRRFELKFPFVICNKVVRDADITIATSWLTSYWVNRLSSAKGKKVYFIQGFETWETEKINQKVIESYRLPFDAKISVGTALHDRLIQEAGCESVVICNGVEECFLKSTGNEKSKENITIGFPYREPKVKNCDMGMRVLLKLKEKYPSIELVSFGFKKPQVWDERIRFVESPSREALVDLYGQMDIFYVPSIYEGWGLPAMEAMAQACCVVAGNSGVIQEIGRDKENCVILDDPGNERETLDKLSELICEPVQVYEIGKKAREVVSGMTSKMSAERFEDVLRQTIY